MCVSLISGLEMNQEEEGSGANQRLGEARGKLKLEGRAVLALQHPVVAHGHRVLDRGLRPRRLLDRQF